MSLNTPRNDDCITHVLRSPEGNPGDALHLLQAQTEESLTRLALRARLDLVKSSLGGGVLLMVVVVVVLMIVLMVMLVLVLGVVGVNFLDGGRHLGDGGSAPSATPTQRHPERGCAIHPNVAA